MRNCDVPLLADFSSYSKSLPVRDYLGSYLQLFKLSYYARSKDLTDMVNAINKSANETRAEVRYISAPPISGKTASILPAFLHSATMQNAGTHYFYLPFNNNNNKNFISMPKTPNPNEDIAERQGAAFIFECVKTLLERPDDINSYTIKIIEDSSDLLLSPQQITEAINEYLTLKIGNNCNIWFHIDV